MTASCVSFQLSSNAIVAPLASCSSKVGSCNAPGTPNAVSEGPIARRITLFGSVPLMIKPPMPTLSAVCTSRRVEMFNCLPVRTTESGSFGSVPDLNSDRLSSPSPSASPLCPPSAGLLIWCKDKRAASQLMKSTWGAMPTRVTNGSGFPARVSIQTGTAGTFTFVGSATPW